MSRFLVIIFLLLPFPLRADIWVDEDGVSFVSIEGSILSVYSLDDFYYFDELFTSARRGAYLNLCLGGAEGSGMASDCLGPFKAAARTYNQGKNRALHFNINDFPFVFEAFENSLRNRQTMKLSIDDNDLFTAYTLHEKHTLTNEALNVLLLDD